MTRVSIQTVEGNFSAYFGTNGLVRLQFPSEALDSNSQVENFSTVAENFPAVWIDQVRSALLAILEGKDPDQLPPMDISKGTEFQQNVWKVLSSIPMGKTMTYLEVAQHLNKPGALRAVGQACGANPIPVLIPCHRVLAAGGKIGGFSGGLDWKKKLLRREGVLALAEQAELLEL